MISFLCFLSEPGRSGILEGGDPLDISVTVSGEQIRMFGSCVELTVNDGSYSGGMIGFFAQDEAEFDNIKVKVIK